MQGQDKSLLCLPGLCDGSGWTYAEVCRQLERITTVTQDAASGREGRDFGMKTGRALAAQLGTLVSKTATELRLPARRMATLRVARNSNTTFGCLNALRDRVDVVLCAYTKDGRSFDLWELPVAIWRLHAREASTGSTLRGKLTQMSHSAVNAHGKALGRVELNEG